MRGLRVYDKDLGAMRIPVWNCIRMTFRLASLGIGICGYLLYINSYVHRMV
jgi:hypothetical protein